MNNRILATFLWFNVGWVTGAMATYFLGLPEGLNIALAITIAAVVGLDPTHRLWPVERRTVRSNRSADSSRTAERLVAE